MIDLKNHPYFTEYVDEKSGVVSYILSKRIAHMQQHFYFAQPSITDDGKYLWFTCANPPASKKHLAVLSLDAENPFIREFQQTETTGAENIPVIIPGEHSVVFGIGDSVYKIDVEGNVTKLLTLDEEFVHNRLIRRIFTHASLSPDKKEILLDMHIGEKWYIGVGNLETGKVKIINNFGRCYDHAMFSPTKEGLFLIDQDWWRDIHTGEYFPIDNRMWLMNTNGKYFEPVIANQFYERDGSSICHDFWSNDGYLCWIDYNTGAFECNVDTREINHIWKRPICHAHTSSDRKMWCCDQTPYLWKEKPCQVLFYDRETNKEIEIFSELPFPNVERGVYHHDPHPQFVYDDKYIVSTTSVMNRFVDIAITPVKELREKCIIEGKQL